MAKTCVVASASPAAKLLAHAPHTTGLGRVNIESTLGRHVVELGYGAFWKYGVDNVLELELVEVL